MGRFSPLVLMMCVLLLHSPEVGGQTCQMIEQADKKIPDSASPGFRGSGFTFTQCEDDCLADADCWFIELRGANLCIGSSDSGVVLSDSSGSRSSKKTCTSDATTTSIATTTDADTTTISIRWTTENAQSIRPILTLVVLALALAVLISRNQ